MIQLTCDSAIAHLCTFLFTTPLPLFHDLVEGTSPEVSRLSLSLFPRPLNPSLHIARLCFFSDLNASSASHVPFAPNLAHNMVYPWPLRMIPDPRSMSLLLLMAQRLATPWYALHVLTTHSLWLSTPYSRTLLLTYATSRCSHP